MRETMKGRRKVEEAEFCLNCNKLSHTKEIDRLTAENKRLLNQNRNLRGALGNRDTDLRRVSERESNLYVQIVAWKRALDLTVEFAEHLECPASTQAYYDTINAGEQAASALREAERLEEELG